MILRSHIGAWVGLMLALAAGGAKGEANLHDLNQAFSEQKWDAAAEIAYEILQRYPNTPEAYLKGAYALFQKGYANSALMFLKRMSMDQWRSLPQGQDRFTEVVSLFQKKVPLTVLPGRLDQINQNEVPSYLRDEVLFAKGRAAYEAKRTEEAKGFLSSVSPNSRFYLEAHYLLTCVAVELQDYDTALKQVTKIFETQVFQQASEFWKDISTQMTTHWGANFKVYLDASLLVRTNQIAELGNLAGARLRYAKKQYELALEEYEKIPRDSPHYARAHLERIWALLQLNQHDDARKEALKLQQAANRFEAIEARIQQAVILADAHRGDEARKVLDEFDALYRTLSAELVKYRDYGVMKALPQFIHEEIKRDQRILDIDSYISNVQAEIATLRSASQRLFPVYRSMAVQLDGLVLESRRVVAAITREIVEQRMRDLDALYVQSRLIRAETYLDDRDKLRAHFQSLGNVTEELQAQHDQQLVDLLTHVVDIVEGTFPKMRRRNPHLEFRHTEMLWELGTARLILAQTKDKKKNEELGDNYRKRSMAMAERVVRDFPNFVKRAQAMFLLGFSQTELDDEKKAIATLKAYVEQYPNHTHVPDAYRIIGDHYFDRNDFQTAEENFVRILAFEDSPIIGYAYYKIAWCNYNKRNYAKALLGLEKAIVWAKQSQEKAELLSLKREASNDLVSVYAEVGDARKAMEYFESFLGGDTHNWMSQLAKKYDETGQYEKSTFVYNVLISLNDSPDKGLENYAPIIRGHFRLLQWEDVVKATTELVENYRDKLVAPTPKDTPAFVAEETVRDVAMAQHFEFSAGEDPAVIERVIKLDRLYLSAFGKWPSSQPVQYRHAYFLAQKKRYREAAEAYRNHWLQFRDTLKEPLREESLRNVLHTLELLDNERKKAVAVASGVTPSPTPDANDVQAAAEVPPEEMTEEVKSLLHFAEEYTTLYPKSKHARAISFLYGTTLLKYGKLEEGIAVSQKIFDADNKDNFGQNAFKNLRVAYYKKKDWAAAYQWASSLLSRSAVDIKEYAPDLQTVKEEALFLWANNTKENADSAKLFLDLVADPKAGRLREKALYNAIVRYHQMEDRVKVLQYSRDLEKLAPKSEFLPLLNGIRGAILQEAGDYVQALPFLLRLIKEPPKDIAPDVLLQARLNAALILQGLEQRDTALALYRQYLEQAPDKSGKGALQANAGIKYIEARLKRAPASVYKPWDGLVAAKRNFETLPLPKKGGLADRIKKGGASLEQVVSAFTEAAGSKDVPEFHAFEALCAVPNLYRAFAGGVRGLVLGLPEEARAEVAAELEKIAKPMDDKAAKWADDCLTKAFQAEHDGPFLREVNRIWGWETDGVLQGKVDSLIQSLEARGPWIWPSNDGRSEAEIIERHLKKPGDFSSWYALAKARLDAKKWSLSRLTLLDTMTKIEGDAPEATPGPPPEVEEGQPAPIVPRDSTRKGRILNALAYIEQATLNPKGITALYQTAADEGSNFALINMAILDLKGGRLSRARELLRRAMMAGVFERDPELKKLVVEVVGS